jgi:hypothetical protein
MTKKELLERLYKLDEPRKKYGGYNHFYKEKYAYEGEGFGDFINGMHFISKKEALRNLADMKKSDFYKEDFAEYKRKKKEVSND